MAGTKIDSADYTDFSSKDYADTAAAQDATLYPSSFAVDAGDQTTQSSYQNTNWSTQWGAYFQISELGGLIDRKAQYIVGKGFKIPGVKAKVGLGGVAKMLSKIRGNGLDTFNGIMYNAVRVYTIGGDFYAEIMKNKRGDLKNLKPLNPSTVKVIANGKGIIKKYEVQPISSQKAVPLEPEEMFHLSYNRLADQIHGQSVISKLMPIIEMRREAMKDLRVVFHRYVKPLLISSVDTDDTKEIAAYKAKLDSAMEKGENMVVPKGVVDNIDKISIPQFSTLDPLPWIELLQTEFIKAEGVPAVVQGISAKGTESESKILYLSWQQIVEFNQMFLEEQIKAQLGIDVEFEFPADIGPVLQQDEKKDKGNDAGIGKGKNA